MINTAGMSPMLALTLIERERPIFEKGIAENPTSKREIAAFQERIGSIANVDDLMKDFEVYSFVMKAYGMEEQLYAKAMMKKILTSDLEDKSSLANKLTNSDYKLINQAMGFDTDGNAPENFQDPEWVQALVDRYVDQRLIDNQDVINSSVGTALNFLDKVESFDSWYKVLGNKNAARFMRVALGIPEAVASGDIDAQKRLFEKKMNIEDLQDPDKVKRLVRQFAAIEGANRAAMEPVGILTLFSPATSSGTWSPITIDMEMVTGYSASAYR